MKPRPPPRRNPGLARYGKYALYAGGGVVALYALRGAYRFITTPAPALRAGASLAFKQGMEGAAPTGQPDLGIVWYGSENHTLTEAVNKIITDARAGRYLTSTVNAPGSQYALKTATADGSAMLKSALWLAVAGSYLRNANLLTVAEDYKKRGFAAASGLTGDSGNYDSVRAIYIAAGANLTPYQRDKQIQYVMAILGNPVKNPGSYDVQRQAEQDKQVLVNTAKETGQDIADAGYKAANVLAWVGGVITGKPPIGSNPIAFAAWKWGARLAIAGGAFLVVRAYTRPYISAAKATVQRVTGGADEAMEAIQNGARAVRKMIG